MSEIMTPIPFENLLKWMMTEYTKEETVFGLKRDHFYAPQKQSKTSVMGGFIGSPVGAAAGPNTQLAQNIVVAYAGGLRVIELKTVQTMDGEELRNCVGRPCIFAEKEGYNCEWSTELTVEQAFEEYAKAWVLTHIIAKEFGLGEGDFMFNMSVGYDFEGITSDKIDGFIENLRDASRTTIFSEIKAIALENIALFKNVKAQDIINIPKQISNAITLSTLHGCPPEEIEKIATYLIKQKQMHTYIKLNPTLLGYSFVRSTLDNMGYTDIDFDNTHFEQDLKYDDAVPMMTRLKKIAKQKNVAFGAKITNTFPVKSGGLLPADYMYMSGKALYPLAINVAAKLATEFKGDLPISYSGGADAFNVSDIYAVGIKPITVATTILKPGGYARAKQLSEACEDIKDRKTVDVKTLNALAQSALTNSTYAYNEDLKEYKKNDIKLPLTDCYFAPCKETGCPINQQIPAYLKLAADGAFDRAFEVVVNDNVLPSLTGEICNHNCQTKCNRVDYDSPLEIRQVKKLIAQEAQDKYIDRYVTKDVVTSKEVCVVGAGPGGMATASYLRRNGVAVTVIEKQAVPMGVVGHVVPSFRIEDKLINRDFDMAKKYGVKFKFNTPWDMKVATLKKDYDFVVIATGAYEPGYNPVSEGKAYVVDALTFLTENKKLKGKMDLGDHVGVIGGGDVTMDCARAAKRSGAKKVSILYRRTKRFMPAEPEELQLAIKEGVGMMELLAPKTYDGKTLMYEVTELGDFGADGRRTVHGTGKTKAIEVNYLIAATGSKVNQQQYTSNHIALNKKGALKLTDYFETNVSNVYVAGDCRKGPATIVRAMADGKEVAKDILTKLGIEADFVQYDDSMTQEEAHLRKGSLIEPLAVQYEGTRCLGCDTICELCVDVCPNRANQVVQMADGSRQIIHIDGMCNACGNCGVFCPYNGNPYKDKLTLFWSETDMRDSKNQGFYIKLDGSFLFRIGKTDIEEMVLDDKKVPTEIWAIVKRILAQNDYWVV